MTDALVAGIAAGLGIAIPVGAIAVLILETAVRRGFGAGAAAAAPAPAADGLYAAVAMLGGIAIVALVEPVERPLRLVAAAVLIAVAVRGFVSVRRGASAGDASVGRAPSNVSVFARTLALTLLNPATIVYFAALVVGLAEVGSDPASRAAFVIGAFAASLVWQTSLAAVGATVGGRASTRVRTGTVVLGNVIILVLAARIALDAITGTGGIS